MDTFNEDDAAVAALRTESVRGQVPVSGLRARSANVRRKCSVTDANALVKTTETPEDDEQPHPPMLAALLQCGKTGRGDELQAIPRDVRSAAPGCVNAPSCQCAPETTLSAAGASAPDCDDSRAMRRLRFANCRVCMTQCCASMNRKPTRG